MVGEECGGISQLGKIWLEDNTKSEYHENLNGSGLCSARNA